MKYISVDEYLMGRATLETLPPDYIANINTLIPKVNDLLEAFGEYRKVVSGYRTQAINDATSNAAKKSKHLICAAVDLADANGKLKAFCEADDAAMLKKYDLYMEAASACPTWCHLSFIAPKSGKRVFIP